MNRFNVLSLRYLRSFYSFLSLFFAIFILYSIISRDLCAEPSINTIDDNHCRIPNNYRIKPPISDSEPITIDISMFILDIMDIMDVSQTYNADVLFHYTWRDHRLSKDSIGRSLTNCEFKLSEVWHPNMVEINIKRVNKFFDELAVVLDESGNLSYRQRYVGEFIANLEYEDFPFDSQILKFILAPTGVDADNINFHINNDNIIMRPELAIEGWEISILKPIVFKVRTIHDRIVPVVEFRLLADRDESYYIWKVLLPLCLIVLMSWAVFWIDPQQIGAQIGLSTATVFTLIAYRFSIGLTLPKVSYFTKIDTFVFFSTILVFISLGIAVLSSRIASSGNLQRALRIERVARIKYLILYIIIILFAFWP